MSSQTNTLSKRAIYLSGLLQTYGESKNIITSDDALLVTQAWFYVAYMMRFDPPATPHGRPRVVILRGRSPHFYSPLSQLDNSYLHIHRHNQRAIFSRDGKVPVTTLFLYEEPSRPSYYYVTDFLFRPFANVAAHFTEYGQFRITVAQANGKRIILTQNKAPPELGPNAPAGPPVIYHELKDTDTQATLFEQYVHKLNPSPLKEANTFTFLNSDGKTLTFEGVNGTPFGISIYKRGSRPIPVLRQL